MERMESGGVGEGAMGRRAKSPRRCVGKTHVQGVRRILGRLQLQEAVCRIEDRLQGHRQVDRRREVRRAVRCRRAQLLARRYKRRVAPRPLRWWWPQGKE